MLNSAKLWTLTFSGTRGIYFILCSGLCACVHGVISGFNNTSIQVKLNEPAEIISIDNGFNDCAFYAQTLGFYLPRMIKQQQKRPQPL